MHIGQYIKEKRKEKKLTIHAMANKVELSASYLSMVENGQRDATFGVLKTLAEKLDLNLTEMLKVAGLLDENKDDDSNTRTTIVDLEKLLNEAPVFWGEEPMSLEQKRLAANLIRVIMDK